MLLPAHCHGFLSHFTSRAPSPQHAKRDGTVRACPLMPHFTVLIHGLKLLLWNCGDVDNVSALKPSFSAGNLPTQRCKTKMVNLEGFVFFFLGWDIEGKM